MKLYLRKYQGTRDQARMMALVHNHPQENFHIIDLPYRSSSWALDTTETIGLWEDAQGELRAWVVLQTPFWAMDFAFHPETTVTTRTQVFEWADERAAQLRETPYGRPLWFVNVFEGQKERRQELEAQGFMDCATMDKNPWSKVFLELTDVPTLANAPFAEGFQIRPLNGVAEVDAYVALHRAVFQSTSMTHEWRQRTLEHPDYQPALDLVAVDAEGQLAAFCICWFAEQGVDGRPTGQIEPLGVREDARGKGLARSLLTEGIRRLYQHGAERIVVETDKYRTPALSVYERVGFRLRENIRVYRKEY